MNKNFSEIIDSYNNSELSKNIIKFSGEVSAEIDNEHGMVLIN